MSNIYQVGWVVVSVLWISSQDKTKEFEIQGKVKRKSNEARSVKTPSKECTSTKAALRSSNLNSIKLPSLFTGAQRRIKAHTPFIPQCWNAKVRLGVSVVCR
jgi:hypothetical protein